MRGEARAGNVFFPSGVKAVSECPETIGFTVANDLPAGNLWTEGPESRPSQLVRHLARNGTAFVPEGVMNPAFRGLRG